MPCRPEALHAWTRHLVIERPAGCAVAGAPAGGLTAHWICSRCGAQRFEAAWRGVERRKAPRGHGIDARA